MSELYNYKGIYGFDVSYHNGANGEGIAEGLKILPEAKFVIIKATEGVRYMDKAFMANYEAAVAQDLIIGIYHYARPDLLNLPEAEALDFIDAFNKTKKEGVFMALDFEGASLQLQYNEWALRWCKEVERYTGVKPMVYTNQYGLQFVNGCAENDNGLWLATRSMEKIPENIGKWPFTAIWQYSSEGIDRNFFLGATEQLLKYAYHNPAETEPPVWPETYTARCPHCGESIRLVGVNE